MGRGSLKMTQAQLPSWRSPLESLPPNGATWPCHTVWTLTLCHRVAPATAPRLGQLGCWYPAPGPPGWTRSDRRSTHLLARGGGCGTQHMATFSSGKCRLCSPDPSRLLMSPSRVGGVGGRCWHPAQGRVDHLDAVTQGGAPDERPADGSQPQVLIGRGHVQPDPGHNTRLPWSEPHPRVGRSPGGRVEVVFRARL